MNIQQAIEELQAYNPALPLKILIEGVRDYEEFTLTLKDGTVILEPKLK